MSNTQLFPPHPPTDCASLMQNGVKFGPCDFEYLPSSTREYVKDAYEVISRNELWKPFREALLTRGVSAKTGFMFTDDPLYKTIQNKIASTKIGGLHSGFSMAFVMREIEFIALNGEPAYKVIIRYQTAAE